MKKNILVIPDSHCRPGVPVERFKWLGKFISARKPDVIVHLGDLWDMPSLCSYDYGTIHAENQRYRNDLMAGWAALTAMNDNIVGVSPECFILMGNHEHRVVKTIEKTPALADQISMRDFECTAYGWHPVPFLEHLDIEGVIFSHYFISGVMGRPISGVNAAANIIGKQFRSCVAGHSHLYDYAERTDAKGKKLQAIVAGCFLEPGQHERYAGNANAMWRNAVTYLHDVQDGNFDHEVISIERLKRDYAA